MSSNIPRWYAIEVRTQYERRVALALGEKGYEQFAPVFLRRRPYAGQIREVEQPFFPGYVFCRFDVYRRLPILTTPNVRRVVGYGKSLIPVEDHEIEALQAVVRSSVGVRPWPYLKAGQRVRITSGAMEDVEGILVAFKSHHRLVLSVDLLERSVAVDVDEAWVAPIPSGKQGSASKPVKGGGPTGRASQTRQRTVMQVTRF